MKLDDKIVSKTLFSPVAYGYVPFIFSIDITVCMYPCSEPFDKLTWRSWYIACLTRNRWMSVSRQFEPHQTLPLFP